MNNEMLSDFINFLRANFHQDIISTDEAINEILTEESNDYLLYVVEFLTEFICSDFTNEEKVKIIKDNTSIYYDNDKEYLIFISKILYMIKEKNEKQIELEG